MKWFERYVVAQLAPRAALRRMAAQRAVKAFYEAAEPTRYRKARNDRRSANAQNLRAVEQIRAAARHMDENYDIASGILDVLVSNIVGTGIQPEPQVMLTNGKPAVDTNRALLAYYDDWRFRPEVTWQSDYYGSQRLMARSWLRDGEVFCQRITGKVPGLDHGTLVPYSIEALEADLVPFSTNDPAKGIVQGVELSAWGRPKSYHVYKTHPGEQNGVSAELKTVGADKMLHLAFRKRLHQVRGVSIFSSVLNRIDDIKEIDEFERIAAKVAAAFTGYIKKGTADDYEGGAGGEGSEGSGDGTNEFGRRELGMEPGMIIDDLQPGEDIGTMNSTRPNNGLIPFRDSQLRAAAAGVGASFSSISKNYDGSYSAQRQELVEHTGIYRSLQGAFVYSIAQPVWDGFIDAALLTKGFKLEEGVDKTTIYDCTHTGPAMPWIDPQKEVDAQVTAMEKGLTSRSRVIRLRGDNPDQIARERVRDREEAKELGLEEPAPTTAAPDPKKPDEPEPPTSRTRRRPPRSRA